MRISSLTSSAVRLATLAVVALVLSGCMGMMGGEEDDMMMMAPMQYEGVFEPEAPGDLRAAARVNTTAANTAVAVSIADAPDDAVYPWHIHRGVCGSGGPIVGTPESYPLLRAGPGVTTETAQIDVPLMQAERYYINFHASPQMLGEIVACVPLVAA